MRGRTMMTAALALSIAAVAACERAAPSTPSTLDTELTVEPAPAPSSILSQLDGLVVLLDGGDNVAVVAPDGSSRHQLTSDAGPDRTYQQPTWGPTGEQLAWVRVDSGDGSVSGHIEVSKADGSDRIDIEAMVVPFYLSWDPTGSSIALLGSGDATIELWLANADTGTLTHLLGGQPFYFSWSPDGSRMLVHLDNTDLRLVDLGGPISSISDRSEGYQAPQWTLSGRLVYADQGTGGLSASLSELAAQAPSTELIVTGPDGSGTEASIPFDGVVTFSLSSDGRTLAYSITASSLRAQVGANFGPLFIVDVTTKEGEELTSQPVVLFQWSPDGRKLLYASLEEGEEGLRWHVWSEGEDRSYGSFRPTGLFTRAYLPFWDQYAQSLSLWSPGSDAFVYASEATGGEEVLVQLLIDDAPSVVANGSFAAWSP